MAIRFALPRPLRKRGEEAEEMSYYNLFHIYLPSRSSSNGGFVGRGQGFVHLVGRKQYLLWLDPVLYRQHKKTFVHLHHANGLTAEKNLMQNLSKDASGQDKQIRKRNQLLFAKPGFTQLQGESNSCCQIIVLTWVQLNSNWWIIESRRGKSWQTQKAWNIRNIERILS